MNTLFIGLGMIALLAIVLACAWLVNWKLANPEKEFTFANIASGIHIDAKTYLTDAAITTRYLLAKAGSDVNHAAVCGASDEPVGIFADTADAAEDPIAVQHLNATDRTRWVIASEAIALSADVYAAASGKVQDTPTSAGTYWKIGKCRKAAGADGDEIEIETHRPVKVVILAALTAPDTANGSDAATTQALANAIKADLVTLETALQGGPAEIKILS